MLYRYQFGEQDHDIFLFSESSPYRDMEGVAMKLNPQCLFGVQYHSRWNNEVFNPVNLDWI